MEKEELQKKVKRDQEKEQEGQRKQRNKEHSSTGFLETKMERREKQ